MTSKGGAVPINPGFLSAFKFKDKGKSKGT